ncbi:MAG: toxin-antitoxin system YwqK family antitoxin [Paludibacter sp.]|nr:toxin-antitoxin system YwqK family antitoxin [Paludibacter sp.]
MEKQKISLKKYLFILVGISIVFSSCSKGVKMNELETKNGVFHLKNKAEVFSGKIQEKYVSGKDSMTAQVDSGLFNGNFIVYYEKGTVKDSIVYSKGVIVKFKRFLSNGSEMKVPDKLLFESKKGLTYIVENKDTLLFCGLSIKCNKDKSIDETTYLNGELNGVSNSYFQNGKISYTRIYKNGKLQGKATEYFSNGNLKEVGFWADGSRIGKWTTYHPNKKIDEVGIYRNANKDSTWNEYYESGKIKLTSNYSVGIKNGKYIAYYENGKVEAKGAFQNNLREGDWIFYNSNGSIDAQQKFSHGNALSKCHCCGKYYNYNEGWTARNPGFSRGAWDLFADGGAGGGPYCSQGCARRCE